MLMTCILRLLGKDVGLRPSPTTAMRKGPSPKTPQNENGGGDDRNCDTQESSRDKTLLPGFAMMTG